MNQHETDVVIIGAGPVGLFAIFECGMVKLKCHVIDALDFTGGQCTALYPEKPIYDIAGFPAIDAQDLIANLEQQAAPFDPVYHLGQQVVGVEKLENSPNGEHYKFKITTSKGTIIRCKAVMIAAGCGAFGPNRPPLQGLAAYEATGSVAYMVGKKEQFRDKNVVIAGGGDSALDWVIALQPVAKRVSLVHRRAKFRAAPDSVAKMEALAAAGEIDLVVPYQLHGLEGDAGQLSGVVVADLDNHTKTIPAEVLLPFYGLAMELGPIADWGMALEKKHLSVNPASLQTSVPGIYAIGDINHYPGKLKLIACGFSEAAMAAHAARHFIHPDEELHFEYSTSKGVPA